MTKMTAKELRETLAREGYEMDRDVRKPQLVAYFEDLLEHRHAEALEMNDKIMALREWHAGVAA